MYKIISITLMVLFCFLFTSGMATAESIIPQEGYFIVDFYADWCPPCKAMKPVVKKYNESETPKIVSLDASKSENEELANKNNVKYVPTFIIFKDGVEISRKVGYLPLEDLKKWVRTHVPRKLTYVLIINTAPDCTELGLARYILDKNGVRVDYELCGTWKGERKEFFLDPGLYGITQRCVKNRIIINYVEVLIKEESDVKVTVDSAEEIRRICSKERR